jgi:hypothetical protein
MLRSGSYPGGDEACVAGLRWALDTVKGSTCIAREAALCDSGWRTAIARENQVPRNLTVSLGYGDVPFGAGEKLVVRDDLGLVQVPTI